MKAHIPAMIDDDVVSIKALSGQGPKFAHGSKFYFVKHFVETASSEAPGNQPVSSEITTISNITEGVLVPSTEVSGFTPSVSPSTTETSIAVVRKSGEELVASELSPQH